VLYAAHPERRELHFSRLQWLAWDDPALGLNAELKTLGAAGRAAYAAVVIVELAEHGFWLMTSRAATCFVQGEAVAAADGAQEPQRRPASN
jgi:hypothetical protein